MRPSYPRIGVVYFALLLICGAARAAVTLDEILVVVNDEIVTEQDLRSASEPVIAQYRATLSGSQLDERLAETRKKVLEQLVEDRLIRSEAKREKIAIDESEVDEMMSDVRKKFPSQEVFEAVLREQGLSIARVRERFKDQILSRRVVDMKVRAEITLSPGEVKDYYDSHHDDFRAPDKVRVRQILLRVGEGHRTAEEAEALTVSILGEIQAGTSMEDLAKRYSEASEGPDGGDLGWVEKGQFADHIDAQIFSLKVGQTTAPVRTQLGYHLFKVEAMKASETRSFEQVRPKIESIIFRKKTAERFSVWIAELRQNAYIERKSL